MYSNSILLVALKRHGTGIPMRTSGKIGRAQLSFFSK